MMDDRMLVELLTDEMMMDEVLAADAALDPLDGLMVGEMMMAAPMDEMMVDDVALEPGERVLSDIMDEMILINPLDTMAKMRVQG